ncbi:MAG TPA: ABC transporter permease [Chthoniobacterales bacterium]|nr:ABC transporter permease [Chthoniobacterales bacterium]
MTDPRSTWTRLRRNPAMIVSTLIVVAVATAALFGPILLTAKSGEVTADSFLPPSLEHAFGTDLNGRDLFFRVLLGARISLLVGIAGAAVSFAVGIIYGMIAGYSGGQIDSLMMRFVDVLYAIPRLIFLLVLISALDPILRGVMEAHRLQNVVGYSKILILVLCLGLTEWLTMARIVRGQVLSLKNQQFVVAARCIGQSHRNIIIQHLLPNLIGVTIVYLTLTVPSVILDESFLSFLGVGVQAPLASWGLLLSDAAQSINPVKGYWWLLVFPAATMSVTLLALNFVGDGLRDALDPRGKQ